VYLLQKSYAESLTPTHKPLLRSGSLLHGNQLFTLYGKAPKEGIVTEPGVLRALDGQTNLAELTSQTNIDCLELVSKLEDRFPGMFDYPGDEQFLKRKEFAQAAAELSNRHQGEAVLESSASLFSYHREGMSGDALKQFETIETTISHMFREPMAALSGRTFGASLADSLLEQNIWDGSGEVLEVGGGTGFLAREFLKEMERRSLKVDGYSILDLSPNLHLSQRDELSSFEGFNLIEANALSFDYSSLNPSLIISNEVIADFSVGRVGFEQIDESKDDREAMELVSTYNLPLSSRGQLVNSGAIRFIESIVPLVQAGSRAWISEYGGPDEIPRRVALDGHAEHSIQFSHLIQVAESCGLRAELRKMSECLSFDMEIPVLDIPSFEILNRCLEIKFGRQRIRKLAWSEEELEKQMGSEFYREFSNLRFSALTDIEGQMTPEIFYVLQLEAGV